MSIFPIISGCKRLQQCREEIFQIIVRPFHLSLQSGTFGHCTKDLITDELPWVITDQSDDIGDRHTTSCDIGQRSDLVSFINIFNHLRQITLNVKTAIVAKHTVRFFVFLLHLRRTDTVPDFRKESGNLIHLPHNLIMGFSGYLQGTFNGCVDRRKRCRLNAQRVIQCCHHLGMLLDSTADRRLCAGVDRRCDRFSRSTDRVDRGGSTFGCVLFLDIRNAGFRFQLIKAVNVRFGPISVLIKSGKVHTGKVVHQIIDVCRCAVTIPVRIIDITGFQIVQSIPRKLHNRLGIFCLHNSVDLLVDSVRRVTKYLDDIRHQLAVHLNSIDQSRHRVAEQLFAGCQEHPGCTGSDSATPCGHTLQLRPNILIRSTLGHIMVHPFRLLSYGCPKNPLPGNLK